MAWGEALTHNRVWNEDRDAPRVREAFVTMMATRTTWPQPADLVAALPAVVEPLALPAKPHDPERAKRMIEKLARELKA